MVASSDDPWIDPPRARVPLRRRVERFPYVPATHTKRDERCAEIYDIQVEGLMKRLAATGLAKVVIGISGGLDSTQAALVAVRAFDRLRLPRTNILGYTLPLIPMALAQAILCYLVAGLLGMKLTANVLLAVAVTLPAAVFFIGIGLLCGSVFNDKQVGGICGALLTNLSAWLSGTWFDLDLVGGAVREQEVVVLLGVVEQFAAALAQAHQRRAGMARRRRADAGEEMGIDALAGLQALVQVVGRHLRATQGHRRMAVRYHENPHPQPFMLEMASAQRRSKLVRSASWASAPAWGVAVSASSTA